MSRKFSPSLVALLLIPAAAWAQQSTAIRVLSAATTFVRDSVARSHGPIVIDEGFLKRGPGVSRADAEAVAQVVRASRGRFGDVVTCDAPRAGARQGCSSRGGTIVVSFARPEIRDAVATVLVVYSSVDERNRLEAQEILMRLSRSTNGRWEVTSWDVVGGT